MNIIRFLASPGICLLIRRAAPAPAVQQPAYDRVASLLRLSTLDANCTMASKDGMIDEDAAGYTVRSDRLPNGVQSCPAEVEVA